MLLKKYINFSKLFLSFYLKNLKLETCKSELRSKLTGCLKLSQCINISVKYKAVQN